MLDLLSFGPMALNKHVKAARNSVLETLKTQQKMERPVQPTYSHEDAVARAFMASNIIANMYLGSDEQHTQVTGAFQINVPCVQIFFLSVQIFFQDYATVSGDANEEGAHQSE